MRIVTRHGWDGGVRERGEPAAHAFRLGERALRASEPLADRETRFVVRDGEAFQRTRRRRGVLSEVLRRLGIGRSRVGLEE
jgi:hypothetical protein